MSQCLQVQQCSPIGRPVLDQQDPLILEDPFLNKQLIIKITLYAPKIQIICLAIVLPC